MVNKCCVPNCKSGYVYKDASNAPPPSSSNLSFHSFPIDPGVRQNWITEMKMKNDPNAVAILDQTCENSHKFGERIKSIGDRIYNTFSKNFSQEINCQENKKRKRKSKGSKDPKDSSARKIRKLQNDTNF